MCGIFGWITDKHKGTPDFETGKRLTDLLAHRGPDDSGYRLIQNCFLGHRRLSIIDLSEAGRQPFASPDNRYHMVFNGEIYNYIEVREELEAAGLNFSTKSDTEVLLKAYIKWGAACLDKVEGMFAFAIYDSFSHELFLCRDHIGQKPLYYTYKNGHFIFSSELRSIIKHPAVDPRVDIESLLKYNLYDFAPYDKSILKGVYKLPPAHYLKLKDGKISLHRYWNSIPKAAAGITMEDALERIDELMLSSVEKHLRADVPYGVFLSGGLDSSLIVSYARRVLKDKELKTFSVSVDFENFNEADVAASVAEKYKTAHNVLHMGEKELKHSINVMIDHIDEPMADPGLINAHFISANAVKDIKVALAGDGGDELFAGYITFKAESIAKIMGKSPEFVIAFLKFIVRRFVPSSQKYMSLDFRLNGFLKGFPGPELLRNQCWVGAMPPEAIHNLYKNIDIPVKFFNRELNENNIFSELIQVSQPVKDSNLVDKMLFQYQKFFLPEFVCAHTDRASMRASLEVRSPLIHKPLIEFANSLPKELKVKNGKLKRIFFELAARHALPDKVLNHPKQGFIFPVAGWLRSHLKETMDEILSEKNVSQIGIIDYSKVKQMKLEHISGKFNHYKPLWNLVIFFKWLRNFPEVNI